MIFMNDKETAITACTGLVLLVVLGSIVSVVVNAWAITKLWTWFIVPLFGLLPLTIAQAAGLGLVASILCKADTTGLKQYDSSSEVSAAISKLFVSAIITPVLYVFIGWIVSGFM